MEALTSHPLILASRVTGTPAFNKAGEKVGHIEDLSVNKVTGQVAYALLSFGGVLGIGERFRPLPWSALDYDPKKGGYVLRISTPNLEKAPAFTASELENFGGEHRAAVDEYYGPFPMV